MKIEISLKDLILFCLVVALFLFVFTQFTKYEAALALGKRQGQIDLNTQNIRTLDQIIGIHDKKIKQLEGLESEPSKK